MKKRMRMTREELAGIVLQRMEEGLLDGIIGNENTMNGQTSRAFIQNGRPFLGKYPEGIEPTEETVVILKEFETEEAKLWFIRNHGWKMDDVYACLYSHMYKRTGSL